MLCKLIICLHIKELIRVLLCFAVLPSPVFNVTVMESKSNKLVLSWSPGHDGFSPFTKCHIRVSPPSTQAALSFNVLRVILTCSFVRSKVKEVSRRKGEVMNTRLINVTVPPFQYEVPGLQALTSYNLSVSCSNEVGASPVTMWIQSNTTEGGM